MIYKELTKDSLSDFSARFNRCFDGVVESVAINYKENKKLPNVNFSIQTQDEESDDGWSSVEFNLMNVEYLKYFEGKTSYRVLSDGLVLKILENGMWGIGFDENQEDEDSSEEFVSVAVGFVAERVNWRVKES